MSSGSSLRHGFDRLLIATTNPGKLREIRAVLTGLPITLESLDAFENLPAPHETGATFAENARLKARYYAERTGLATVAEDSGLEIDALGGEPGVRSARYGGESAPTYFEKFALIERRLAESGSASRRARFVCALALVTNGQLAFEATGVVNGEITQPKGQGGFGYDPVFYYPPYSRTLAEVSESEKLRVSHRGAAFRQLRQFLDPRTPRP